MQLEQESKHLRAERIFDEPRLMSPVSSKNVAKSLNFCFDPPLTASPVANGRVRPCEF
ncbi:hypothetical protein ACGFYA_35170 [Streptomyces sp. NPDC048305]|uniref:hypothetical protein n=1 Tax=Streptomyces sp. NPDC048305 TaxID=3365532 RepID=UPI003714D45F